MKPTRILAACLAATALAGGALPSHAADAVSPSIAAAVADASRPDADKARDEARKPAEMLAFAGVKPGSKVAELIPGRGYFTRVFAKAVGPTGKVYAVIPAAAPPQMGAPSEALAKEAGYANVVVAKQTDTDLGVSEPVDVVWTSQNYHDLHNNGGDPGPLNVAIFKALKPGGIYIVLDHAAKAGSGVNDTSTLHRIDPAAVKAEVLRAGFVFDSESTALKRPADDHTAKAFDLHDQTDQFIYRFKKPG